MRAPIRLAERTTAFVEPMTLVSNGEGALLLAGRNFVAIDSMDEGFREHPLAPAIGVILTDAGYARTVASPSKKPLAAVRAVADSHGGWIVGIAIGDSAAPGSAKSREFYLTRFDGSNWSALEPIPLPDTARFQADLASDLVVVADTVFWALMAPRGDSFYVFEWHAGMLRVERVRHFNAQVALGYAPASGLVAAGISDDGSSAAGPNSLFLWKRADSWARTRILASGWTQSVQRPSLRSDAEVASWIGEVAGRAMLVTQANVLGTALDPSVVLDSSVVFPWNGIPMLATSAGTTWVTAHDLGDGRSEFRVLSYDPDRGKQLVGRIANPLRSAMIMSSARGTDEIFIAALSMSATPPHFAATETIRLQLRCAVVNDAPTAVRRSL